MADWDKRWMKQAKEYASWSKDKSRGVGAVVVRGGKEQVSYGFNGFPKKIDDEKPERHTRPAKYLWTVHAELNAVLKKGDFDGTTMYCTLFPCARCAGPMIQVGICELVTYPPDLTDPNYADEFRVSLEMFEEAGVSVRFIEADDV